MIGARLFLILLRGYFLYDFVMIFMMVDDFLVFLVDFRGYLVGGWGFSRR